MYLAQEGQYVRIMYQRLHPKFENQLQLLEVFLSFFASLVMI